jgi:hypothetical protein
LRRNFYNKSHKLGAVFDLPENNQSKNKDNSPIHQVPTFQKDKKLRDGRIPLVDMLSPRPQQKNFQKIQLSTKTNNLDYTSDQDSEMLDDFKKGKFNSHCYEDEEDNFNDPQAMSIINKLNAETDSGNDEYQDSIITKKKPPQTNWRY